MTNDEILQHALEKAAGKGFCLVLGLVVIGSNLRQYLQMLNHSGSINPYYGIIFRHDFAKAFWGEGEQLDESLFDPMGLWQGGNGGSYGAYFEGKDWQFHLQQMVLAEDPIKYLKKFL